MSPYLIYRGVASGPYGKAVAVALLVTGLIAAGSVYLRIHDHFVAKEARAVCEEKARVAALERQNAAILAAKREAEESLTARTRALSESGTRITTLESELKETRDALAKLEESARVVFPADDPWLRRRLTPKADAAARP